MQGDYIEKFGENYKRVACDDFEVNTIHFFRGKSGIAVRIDNSEDGQEESDDNVQKGVGGAVNKG